MNKETTPPLPESCIDCPFISPYREGYAIVTNQIRILRNLRERLAETIPLDQIDDRIDILIAKQLTHKKTLADLALRTLGCSGVERDSVEIDDSVLTAHRCPSVFMQ